MSASMLVLFLIAAVLIALVVVLFLPTRRYQAPSDARGERSTSAFIDRSDDRFWRGGVFYYNPDDPSLLVPKRFGIGWTFNFANHAAKLLVLVMIGMILLPIALALFDPGFAASGCHPSNCHP